MFAVTQLIQPVIESASETLKICALVLIITGTTEVTLLWVY
jgi:hypothetical protein